MERKGVDVSEFSFGNYRERGFRYIDKTQYVWNLVEGGSSYFLARPRRFGKSMLLSTIEAFFLGKRHLFGGLAIERLAGVDWPTYPVIHLNMAEAEGDTAEDIVQSLLFHLRSVGRDHGLDVAEATPARCIKSIIEEVCRASGRRVVLLIDEYDKPILNVLHKDRDTKEAVLACMRPFYQAVKDMKAREHFVFVTGVSKFSRTSLFSEMNHLTDISQHPAYATMLGFTEGELRSSFPEEIAEAAARFGIDTPSLMRLLRRWYNGFCFACGAERVYNPVSAGNFFNNLEFRNYWYDTGTPQFLVRLVRQDPFQLEQVSETWYEYDDLGKYDIHDISPLVLAIQTGYLTIAEWRLMPDKTYQCRYDFPNKEIRDSWNKGVLADVFQVKDYEVGALSSSLKQSLANVDVASFMEGVSRFFLGNNYSNVGDVNEGFYRLLMQTLLSLVGLPVEAEVQQAVGRADLAAVYAGNAIVFELKVCRRGESAEKKLREASEQIRERHYTAKYSVCCRHVKAIAVVFSESTHAIEKWELVEDKAL